MCRENDNVTEEEEEEEEATRLVNGSPHSIFVDHPGSDLLSLER